MRAIHPDGREFGKQPGGRSCAERRAKSVAPRKRNIFAWRRRLIPRVMQYPRQECVSVSREKVQTSRREIWNERIGLSRRRGTLFSPGELRTAGACSTESCGDWIGALRRVLSAGSTSGETLFSAGELRATPEPCLRPGDWLRAGHRSLCRGNWKWLARDRRPLQHRRRSHLGRLANPHRKDAPGVDWQR